MGDVLNQINSPADLKEMNTPELRQLCSEIRQYMLEQVAMTGGHLAPNLGVVELTVALHYVLQQPQDRVVWDVGHQTYVHKILTGRKDCMHTLRQFQGMSGFPKRNESAYDAFGTGHSSTSISAALGMAIARDLQQEDYTVAAVIGDGALTGGMSMEALSHAGHEGRKLLVILNDNAMSISPNVGALSNHLNRLRSAPAYHRTKEKIEDHLRRIPMVGNGLAWSLGKVKDMIRFAAVKKGTLFEELGFTYIGPVDGHNLEDLISVLENTTQLQEPVLLHVVTQKGRGYTPAEENPDLFHGIGPFDLTTGQPLSSGGKTYTQIFSDFMLQQAEQYPQLVGITAAMASGTGLKPFAAKYPQRFFDVGICEQHAVTLAAGMACDGLRPVVCLYSTFLQRAYDQIIHDIALQNLPVIFAIDRAGLVGDDGPTHHGVFDLAFLREIPNLTILAPANGQELAAMLKEALQITGPVAIRYPRGEADLPCEMLSIGEAYAQGEWSRQGQKIALIAAGKACNLAEKTCDLLEGEGFQPGLLHIRMVKPLNKDVILQAAQQYAYLVTLEDSLLSGGFGSSVLEILADAGVKADILRIGIGDQFVEQGKVEQLWQTLGMMPEQIVYRIQERWPALRSRGVNQERIWG